MKQPATHSKDTPIAVPASTAADADFRRLCDDTPVLVWMTDTTGATFHCNKALRAYTGQPAQTDNAAWLENIHPDERETVRTRFHAHLAARTPWRAEYRLRRHDGTYRWLLSHAAPRHDSRNRFAGFTGYCLDFNDQRELAETALAESEKKLIQSQKVEASGLLAGGIAHDFNNLLTVIRACTELVQKDLARLPAPDAVQALRAHATRIENATTRASRLVRQLLAFSRNQRTIIERLDINTLILDLKDLLATFLRASIRLDIQPGPAPVCAHADRNQIEQVILNLAINSRDAMPNGGRLTIKAATVRIDTHAHPELEPGDYAQILVTDTGTGIHPDVQDKLFIPFFSTKPKNRGTGLGLPTCANIITNARGTITFDTTLGEGTTFIVLLPDFPPAETAPASPAASADANTPTPFPTDTPTPFPANTPTPFPADTPAVSANSTVAPSAPSSAAAPVNPATSSATSATTPAAVPAAAIAPTVPTAPADAPPTGNETIILVEDDPMIRDVTTVILESLGYTVRACDNGETLIAQYQADPAPYARARLLITDLNMPGIGGIQLASRMRTLHPGALRILYISGLAGESMPAIDAAFLEKPFTRDTLARKVRETLDN